MAGAVRAGSVLAERAHEDGARSMRAVKTARTALLVSSPVEKERG